MTQEELSFEAYVVFGNALNLLLNGISAEDQQRLGLPVERLRNLYARIEPAPPHEVPAVVRRLSAEERRLLAEATALCERVAGTETDTLLGSSRETRSVLIGELDRAVPFDREDV